VPEDTPVTIPVDEPIVAIPAAPLLHVPPGVASLNVTVLPWHTVAGPEIGAGKGLTVSVLVVLQPVGNLNVMIVVPATMPVTIPEREPIEAAPVLLVHVPLPTSVSVTVPPTHTVNGPEIGDGNGLTVNTAVAAQPAPSE
jgi:hypothetical protein